MIIPFFVLTMVFKHVKAAGMFSMRHSHQETDSTWNTTWFSTFWRQQISSTVTATNAAFVNRILQRDSVFQQDGPSIAKASPYPRFYYYDPKLNRRSCNYRNPHSTRDKASQKQHSFSLGFTECGSFLYHTSEKKKKFKASPHPRFYNYNPKPNRRSYNHENPIFQPGMELVSSSSIFLSNLMYLDF